MTIIMGGIDYEVARDSLFRARSRFQVPVDIEDLFHDILEYMLRKGKPDGVKPQTWFINSARMYIWTNIIRPSRRQQPEFLEIQPYDWVTELELEEGLPSWVYETISTLGDKHQEVFHMYLLDMTQVEIAEYMGMTPQGVSYYLDFILRRLRSVRREASY